MRTISRKELQTLQNKRREEDMTTIVDSIAESVVSAAEIGEEVYKLTQRAYEEFRQIGFTQILYRPSLEELLDPLRAKFPDVDIRYVEELREYRRGFYQKETMIVINWS
jgi:hypothetical protein